MNKEILSALIGLVGAVNNNGKTDATDAIVCEAFLGADAPEIAERIRREKFSISPNCETCQNPCGNTSDYPMEKFEQWTDEQREIRELIIAEVKRIATDTASALDGNDTTEKVVLPELVYKAISYVGYDLKEEAYLKLLEELKAW